MWSLHMGRGPPGLEHGCRLARWGQSQGLRAEPCSLGTGLHAVCIDLFLQAELIRVL